MNGIVSTVRVEIIFFNGVLSCKSLNPVNPAPVYLFWHVYFFPMYHIKNILFGPMKKLLVVFVLMTVFALSGKSQAITARLDGDIISLSDGRTFNIKKTKLFGAGAAIEMKAPLSAAVTVTQDDGKTIYSSEVPFTYDVQDFQLYDRYFKLEVTEGDKKWSIKLKNDNGFKMIIEEGAAGALVNDPMVSTSGNAAGTGSGNLSGATAGAATWAFFTEEGENFTMFLDGEKINASPSARVTAPNVSGNVKEVRIEFENSAIPKLSKRFPVIGGGTTSIAIRKSKKGEYQFKVIDAPQQ